VKGRGRARRARGDEAKGKAVSALKRNRQVSRIGQHNPFKTLDVRLETNQRSDVVLKTVLRQFRRYYLHQFNATTSYISKKRGKGPDFYREHLKAFVEIIIKKDKRLSLKYTSKGYKSEQSTMKKNEISGFTGDLLILFGAMFYPKDMKAALKGIGSRINNAKVDLIHKTLYSFSYINLHHLYLKSPPFRFLLDLSVKNKEEIFKNYKCNAKHDKAGGDDEEDLDIQDESKDLSPAFYQR